MAVVYLHRRLDTQEVFYVGIGKEKKRAYVTHTRTKHWKNIVNKTPYKVDIVFEDISLKEAQEAEILLIKLYGRKDLGTGNLVNFTDGGELNIGRTRSEEWRKKRSEYMSSKSSWNKGIPWSEDFKQKRSEAYKGYKQSEERRKKHSEKAKGVLNTKKVIDTSTGIIYDSVGKAAEALNLNINTLYAYFCGRVKNKTNLIYY